MRSVQEANQVPWNHGRIIGPKPPLKPKHIWAIRTRLQHEDRVRDLAMFNLAIDSKLRGCDVVKLRVGDVTVGGQVRQRSMVIQQKTGTPVSFEIGETARESLRLWLSVRGGGRPEHGPPSSPEPCTAIKAGQHKAALQVIGAAPGAAGRSPSHSYSP